MYEITKVSENKFVGKVINREGVVLVEHEDASEAEVLAYLSNLSATINEVYFRGNIVRK